MSLLSSNGKRETGSRVQRSDTNNTDLQQLDLSERPSGGHQQSAGSFEQNFTQRCRL